MRRAAVVCAGLLAFVSGCGQSSEMLSGQSAAVLNGDASGPEDNAVVKLASLQSDGTTLHYCTGTLIAPNLVITARHCVVNIVEAPFSCTADGELVASSKGGRMGAAIPPEDIKFYVGPEFKTPVAALGAQVFTTDTTTMCRNDVAVVLLDRELTDVPIAKLRLGAGVKRNESLRVLGYGWDESGNSGVRHSRGGIKVSLIGQSEFNSSDDPTPPRTFVTPGGVLCVGDSGGPAFGSSDELVGVWSQVVGECADQSSKDVFTDVAPFEDMVIRPAFAASGYEPLVAELPGEGGAGGAENASAAGGDGSDNIDTGGTGGAAGEEPPPAGAGGAPDVVVAKPPPRKKRDTGCALAAGAQAGASSVVGLGSALLGLGFLWRRRRSKSLPARRSA